MLNELQEKIRQSDIMPKSLLRLNALLDNDVSFNSKLLVFPTHNIQRQMENVSRNWLRNDFILDFWHLKYWTVAIFFFLKVCGYVFLNKLRKSQCDFHIHNLFCLVNTVNIWTITYIRIQAVYHAKLQPWTKLSGKFHHRTQCLPIRLSKNMICHEYL